MYARDIYKKLTRVETSPQKLLYPEIMRYPDSRILFLCQLPVVNQCSISVKMVVMSEPQCAKVQSKVQNTDETFVSIEVMISQPF